MKVLGAWPKRPSVQIALVALVVLAGALGMCVIETGHAGHGMGTHAMSVDLCTGLALVLPALLLVARPLMTGLVFLDPAAVFAPVSIHLPDPPPKLASAR